MRYVRFITPNYKTIIARIVFLALYGLFVSYLYRDGIFDPTTKHISLAEHYLVLGVFALPLLVVFWSLLGVTGIAYSEKEGSFELRRLGIWRATYHLDEVKGFRRTFQISSYGERHHGCRLKFKRRPSVTLNQYNLTQKGVDEFKAFLLRSGVPALQRSR